MPTHLFFFFVCLFVCFFVLQEKARRMFCVHEGDHLTLLNVYQAFLRVSTCMFNEASNEEDVICVIIDTVLVLIAADCIILLATNATGKRYNIYMHILYRYRANHTSKFKDYG